MKRAIVVGIIFTLVMPAIATNETNSFRLNENGRVLYVGGSGPNNYTKIQDAINDAEDGDSIMVYYGFYNESIIIDKVLLLCGLGMDGKKPVIDGGKNNYTVVILADNCTLKNFTIKIEEEEGTAVKILSSYAMIKDCNIKCGFIGGYGISLYDSLYSIISRNNIYEVYKNGISLYNSSKCNISMNTFHGVNDYPIYLLNSCRNTIFKNDLEDVRINSLMLWNSSNNTITHNIFKKDVEIMYSNYNTIQYNLISTTIIDGSWENVITGNTIKNTLYISCSPCTTIEDNVFNSGGIWLEGRSIHYWTTHIIKNNTLNGKPILYYKNEGHLLISGNASQIILANCSYCTIQNMNITHSDMGIQIGLSYNNVIYNCILSDNKYGISLIYSRDNSITGNNIFNNKAGIHVGYSNGIRITGNEMRNNEVAVSTYETCHTVIEGNVISKNGISLWIGDSLYNEISNNNIEESGVALYLCRAMINFVRYNNFIKNEKSIFIENSFINIFSRSYWSNWPFPLPKPVICHFYIPWVISFVYVIFDWHPAKEPYEWWESE